MTKFDREMHEVNQIAFEKYLEAVDRSAPKLAYKQFRIDKSGNLHPLFVFANETVPVGVWLTAKEGPRTENGKVKSKLGNLAYRPGFHLSEIPYAPHIGLKDKSGKVAFMKPDTVWCECEIYDEIDYTLEAERNGWRNGKFNPQKACLSRIPEYGYYEYKTNNNAYGTWYIADRIKVNRILSDEEVERICWTEFQIHAQPRKAV